MAELKGTTITGNLVVNGDISTNATKIDKTLLDLIYPVGTLYWTNNKDFNPNTSFGGKWTRIINKFILAGDPTEANLPAGKRKLPTENATGKITLTKEQLPEHSHSFTGSSGSAGSHSHTFTPSGTVSSDFTGAEGTTLSNGAHRHSLWSFNDTGDVIAGLLWDRWSNRYGIGANFGGDYDYVYDNGEHEPYVSEEGDHRHSFTPSGTVSSSFTGTPNQSTTEKGSHTHTISGTVGKTGSGFDINIMPPYVIKYCWERGADS